MDGKVCITFLLRQYYVNYIWKRLQHMSHGNDSCEKICTVIILNIGTDRSEQTVQTQIRLLLMEQSDQGLLCLLFCLHLLNTILHCNYNCSNCRTIMVIISGVPVFRIFTVRRKRHFLGKQDCYSDFISLPNLGANSFLKELTLF